METKTVKLSSLVFDKKLLNLRPLNLHYVSRLRQAYRTGANIPLIILEEKSNRVVSGNHRGQAMLQEYGPDYEVEVISKDYATVREFLEDALKENVAHGWMMDQATRKRFSLALTSAGASPEEQAPLFNVSVKRIIDWGKGTVAVVGGDGKWVYEQGKGNIETEGPLTKTQYETHMSKDLGIHIHVMAEQLTRNLRDKLVANSEKNRIVLSELAEAINEFLEGMEKAV